MSGSAGKLINDVVRGIFYISGIPSMSEMKGSQVMPVIPVIPVIQRRQVMQVMSG